MEGGWKSCGVGTHAQGTTASAQRPGGGRLKPSEPWPGAPGGLRGGARRRGLWPPFFRTRFFSREREETSERRDQRSQTPVNAGAAAAMGPDRALKNDHREDFWKVREFCAQVGAPRLPVTPAPGTWRWQGPAGPLSGAKGLAGSRAGQSAAPAGRRPSPASVQVSWRGGPRGGPAQC